MEGFIGLTWTWIDIIFIVSISSKEFLMYDFSTCKSAEKFCCLLGWGLVPNIEAPPEPRARGPRSERDVANDVVFGAAALEMRGDILRIFFPPRMVNDQW